MALLITAGTVGFQFLNGTIVPSLLSDIHLTSIIFKSSNIQLNHACGEQVAETGVRGVGGRGVKCHPIAVGFKQCVSPWRE